MGSVVGEVCPTLHGLLRASGLLAVALFTPSAGPVSFEDKTDEAVGTG